MKIIYLSIILFLLTTGCSISKTSNLALNNKTNNRATPIISTENKKSTTTPILDNFFDEVNNTQEFFLNSLKKDAKEKFEFKMIYNYGQDDKFYEFPEFSSGPFVIKTISYGDWDSATETAYYDIQALKDKKIINSKKIDNYGRVTGIYQIKYGQNNYYNLIQNWTGGSHCCYTVQTISSNGNNLVFGDTVDMNNSDIIDQNNFFVENGGLYFIIYDNRLQYFFNSYAASANMFIPIIYKVNINGGISNAVDEYKQLYKNSADLFAIAINNLKKQNQDAVLSELERLSSSDYPTEAMKKETILPTIIYWLKNSLLSSEDKKAIWQKFDDYFIYFFNNKDLVKTKKQIEDMLKNDIISSQDNQKKAISEDNIELYAKLKVFSSSGGMKFNYYDPEKEKYTKGVSGNDWFWGGAFDDQEKINDFVKYIEEDKDAVFKIVGTNLGEDCGYIDGVCFDNIEIIEIKRVK